MNVQEQSQQEQSQQEQPEIQALDKRYKLYKATSSSKEECDNRKKYIWWQGQYAYATDGRIAVRASLQDISNFALVEYMQLDGKCMSAALYKELLKYKEMAITEDGIEAFLEESNSVLFRFGDPHNEKGEPLKMLDVDSVIARAYQAVEDPENKKYVGFDASLAGRLAEAMGSMHLKFRIYSGNQAMVATPLGSSEDIVGVIMPLTVDQENE